MSEDALLHIKDLPKTISHVGIPEEAYPVPFVLINEDRLYTIANETLYVYLLIQFGSPIAKYSPAYGLSWTAIINFDNNRLYLGGVS